LPDHPGIGGNKDVIDIWHANDNTWTSDKLAAVRSFFTNSATSLSAGLFFVAEGDTAGAVFIYYTCASVASAPSHGKELTLSHIFGVRCHNLQCIIVKLERCPASASIHRHDRDIC
jgi:hypothetical protein